MTCAWREAAGAAPGYANNAPTGLEVSSKEYYGVRPSVIVGVAEHRIHVTKSLVEVGPVAATKEPFLIEALRAGPIMQEAWLFPSGKVALGCSEDSTATTAIGQHTNGREMSPRAVDKARA